MRLVALRTGAAVALGLGMIAFPVLAEDTKPAKEPPAKAPDWTGYVFVADVVGEVVKADDTSVTVRITWYEQQQANKNSARPRLSQNNRNPSQANGRQNQPKVKEQHHDYELEYLPQSLVRVKSLPAKTDEKGKRVAYTQSEIDAARTPGVTGFAASKSDLVPGTIVEVYLIRDKAISAAKATEADLRIKYAVILGKDANPPKDIASSNKDEKKKKN